MIDENQVNTDGIKGLTKIRVTKKNADTYSVYFPFSEVPVEMSEAYFAKNINPEKYVIDFEDDRLPSDS